MNIQDVVDLLKKVRESNPLVHNITNVVVTNFTANGLLALGASPVMAYAKEEVADMAKIAGALVLNIGTLDATAVDSMKLAGGSANAHQVPVVLDPVGAGATAYRTETAKALLSGLRIGILRGNAAEVASVVDRESTIKGVDAGTGSGDPAELARYAAGRLQTVVAITGKEDVVSNGSVTYVVRNGHAILTRVTGTGCLLSSVIGAFAAVEPDPVRASIAALVTYGVAAELAAASTAEQGPGSFQVEFLNRLANVTAGDLERLGRLEQIDD